VHGHDTDGDQGVKPEPEKKILHLTLHRKWFDAIWSGVKKEEYRDAKPYWTKRFYCQPKGMFLTPIQFDLIRFKNGYGQKSPVMIVEWKGIKRSTWNGNPVYAIQLGAIIETTNYAGPKNAKV
jgi:hypothetical protein